MFYAQSSERNLPGPHREGVGYSGKTAADGGFRDEKWLLVLVPSLFRRAACFSSSSSSSSSAAVVVVVGDRCSLRRRRRRRHCGRCGRVDDVGRDRLGSGRRQARHDGSPSAETSPGSSSRQQDSSRAVLRGVLRPNHQYDESSSSSSSVEQSGRGVVVGGKVGVLGAASNKGSQGELLVRAVVGVQCEPSRQPTPRRRRRVWPVWFPRSAPRGSPVPRSLAVRARQRVGKRPQQWRQQRAGAVPGLPRVPRVVLPRHPLRPHV
mmetsp:Transcript_50513/g.101618  ORF Transcript_50513/g.101618 Transcript_50513/m.101618 type:complete len:264 (+) Transcript_50513:154-945(+)